jgi:hypothetical protein
VSKRRHGLQRCRYRGDDGMKRWVGLGVIADDLIYKGRTIAVQPATSVALSPRIATIFRHPAGYQASESDVFDRAHHISVTVSRILRRKVVSC